MPVKILLADKSITIQKVVEMLFSGKEYEVTCVSDGETALSEASRIVPSVILADVDLPRLDGYGFSARLRETTALAKIPVILMLSRDDQFDAARGRLSGIVDNIAKPFESQELIGKVKKALASAPAVTAAPAEKASPTRPIAAPPPPPAPRPVASPQPPQKAKQPVPSDIFDIIKEAPATAAPAAVPIRQTAPAASPLPKEEGAVEAEPEIEVEPEYEIEPEIEEPSMPPAQRVPRSAEGPAVSEETEIEAEVMAGSPEEVSDAQEAEQLFGRVPEPEATFEPTVEAEVVEDASSGTGPFDFSEPLPSDTEAALPLGARAMEEMREGLGLGGERDETFGEAESHPDIVSFESLDMASRVDHEDYAPPMSERLKAPLAPAATPPPAYAPPGPLPAVTEEMLSSIYQDAVQKVAREVLERVAWEVIPELAERLIREEIERLKAGS
jgi:CheY-like chemotaxis protein